MSSIIVELEMPSGMDEFRLPDGVQNRLQELLDRQDMGQPLTHSEQREAEVLLIWRKCSR